MSRLIVLLILIGACAARSATEKYPFTPRAAVEPTVSCTSDDDCGHGFCRKSKCMCEYNWATEFVSEPCAYDRYSKTTALLLQIFLGAFGVGIAVLGWHGAIAFYWSFVVLTCCFGSTFTVYAEDDKHVGRGICAAAMGSLTVIGFLSTYITAIVYIAGDECMDANGFACGS